MRLNESRTRPFQAPATVHTFPGRQLFVFPNGRSDSDESSEEELNVMELRPRGKEQPRSSSRDRLGDVVLLERELTQEDSLNKLALQYVLPCHCSLSCLTTQQLYAAAETRGLRGIAATKQKRHPSRF
uniref:Uncharacterized protein n=1 Tax=Ficedula albicollis TaxID=59894 RepID=U3K6T6_FICAL